MFTRTPTLIRLDDIGTHTPRNQIIYDLCQAGLCVTCAVVPMWLTAQCVEFLTETAACFPGKVEVHQHGYAHEDHDDGTLEKYEFGPRRLYQDQVKDILEGRRILEAKFGSLFFPAFTPPWGSLDRNTARALREAEFKIVSGYQYNYWPHLIMEFVPDIDCFHWDPLREKSWEEIVQEWRAGSHLASRGLILHPWLMTDESAAQFASCAPGLLARAKTVTFADLVKGS